MLVSNDSHSQLDDLYDDPEFKIAWDNDIKHQVASNLFHLRQYRDWSQERLAREAGTSQSKIARIETGEENVTLNTVERVVVALGGRVSISIQPQEVESLRIPVWWESRRIPAGAVAWCENALGKQFFFYVSQPSSQVLLTSDEVKWSQIAYGKTAQP